MNDNPYASPIDGTRNRWFRPWRVLIAVFVFLAIVVGPIAWQAARERRARHRAERNLDQIRQALEAYQGRLPQQIPDAHADDEQPQEAD